MAFVPTVLKIFSVNFFWVLVFGCCFVSRAQVLPPDEGIYIYFWFFFCYIKWFCFVGLVFFYFFSVCCEKQFGSYFLMDKETSSACVWWLRIWGKMTGNCYLINHCHSARFIFLFRILKIKLRRWLLKITNHFASVFSLVFAVLSRDALIGFWEFELNKFHFTLSFSFIYQNFVSMRQKRRKL